MIDELKLQLARRYPTLKIYQINKSVENYTNAVMQQIALQFATVTNEGSSSFHMEIRPVTPTWWWSPVELVGSRRPVGGRVGNPQGCPSGHPQESAAGAQSGSLRKRACPQIHRTFH